MVDMDQFVPKYQKMDPLTEDLITSLQLHNGMKVLVDERDHRASDKDIAAGPWGISRALINNRWCIVSELELRSVGNTPEYSFVGIYEDGTKCIRRGSGHIMWLFKTDMPTEDHGLYQLVFNLVNQVHLASSAEDYYSDGAGEIGLLVETTTQKIMNLFGKGK